VAGQSASTQFQNSIICVEQLKEFWKWARKHSQIELHTCQWQWKTKLRYKKPRWNYWYRL